MGAVGVAVYLALVYVQIQFMRYEFQMAQTIASSIVIAINFWLNNILTFRSRRLRGVRAFTGLLVFYLACSIGLLANVWVAKYAAVRRSPLGAGRPGQWNHHRVRVELLDDLRFRLGGESPAECRQNGSPIMTAQPIKSLPPLKFWILLGLTYVVAHALRQAGHDRR